MRVEHLTIEGFRNLDRVDVDVGQRFVLIHGDNAQGKTNLIGAVYLLSTLKPLRGHRTRDLVGWDHDAAGVAAEVAHDGLLRRYRIDITAKGRQVQLDGSVVRDLEPYFRGIRAVAFTPSDARIVMGEPKLRRAWLDRAAFTARPSHLFAVRQYTRVLEQKSAALRQGQGGALLDVYDQQLATAGAELITRRLDILAELNGPVSTVHTRITGLSEQLSVSYRSKTEGDSVVQRAASLAEQLRTARADEVRRQRTLAGPQLDDVRLELDDRAARSFGSQGQVRSVVLSLKLGELLAAHARGDQPLFLFDDVSSELDATRTERLIALLSEVDAQVFATTTDATQLDALPPGQTARLRVVSGQVQQES